MVIYVLGHNMINSSPWLNSDRSLITENNWQVSLQWDVIDFSPSLCRSAQQSINSELAQKHCYRKLFQKLSTEQMIFYHTNGFFSPLVLESEDICHLWTSASKRALWRTSKHLWFQSLPALVLICLVQESVFLDYMSNTDVKVRQEIFSWPHS